MPLNKQEIKVLEKKVHEMRSLCVDTVSWAGGGHIGGSLSAMDVLVILYYKYMNIDPKNPNWADRDILIVSKGHIGVGYAPVLADKGYFSKELLKEYNHTGSSLGMHLDSTKVPGVDASTGSLGHGLSIALGTAIAARLQDKTYTTYCLLGDGECNEGAIWEAAMAASHYNVTNMITIVDRNRCMIDGPTEDVMGLEPFAEKWKAFGFIVKEVDGHSFKELSEAIEYAQGETRAPVVIIANTIKGCGIDFMEDDYRWHYGALDSEKVQQSKDSLAKYYEARLKGE
ncbi:MAG TPA: transketolase [Clostridia bacterium]|nr:transketolase [Clostridia bacterium]